MIFREFMCAYVRWCMFERMLLWHLNCTWQWVYQGVKWLQMYFHIQYVPVSLVNLWICLYDSVLHLFWTSICVHRLSFPLFLHLSHIFFLFVYIVVNMPRQLACTVYIPVHMAVANVEVPACTASFLTFCCSFIPSQEKVFKNSWQALLFFLSHQFGSVLAERHRMSRNNWLSFTIKATLTLNTLTLNILNILTLISV